MKNRKIANFGRTFLLSLLLWACGEGFLEVNSNRETATALKSDKAVELVNAVYNSFLSWQMSSFSWIGVSSITSDDADKGSDLGDTGTDKHRLDALDIDPTLLSLEEVWQAHYDGIQRANQALSRLPAFNKLDDKLKKRLIGEAKFLRALMYFRLTQVYGGVPLIKGVLSSKANPDVILKRATKEAVYNFITKDLEDAIQGLWKKTDYPAEELGRATKGAAQALLAKVAMYRKKWDVVKKLTDDIIDSGIYSLTNNYEDIWKAIGENNAESIFEIQARAESPAAGVDKYSTTQGARGVGGWGWGFNTPTQDLVNAYPVGDKRKDATIIFRGETLFDGRLVPNTVVNERYNQKAYTRKFTDAEQTGKNIRILRYAEVLLMNAEAAVNLGGDASTSLNLVRARAGLSPLRAPTQKDVWKERRLELAFEHDRFFDLVRQGRAGAVLRKHGKDFVDGKHEVFPIPQAQIDKSAGVLKQNPGY